MSLSAGRTSWIVRSKWTTDPPIVTASSITAVVLPRPCDCGASRFDRRTPPGFHTTAENSKRTHLRVPALQTPPKFHEKTPEREKESEKKKREIFGPHPSGPHPSSPTLRAPTFSESGPPPLRDPTPPGYHLPALTDRGARTRAPTLRAEAVFFWFRPLRSSFYHNLHFLGFVHFLLFLFLARFFDFCDFFSFLLGIFCIFLFISFFQVGGRGRRANPKPQTRFQFGVGGRGLLQKK